VADDERRRWAVPPATGRLGDVDLDGLDPDDDEQRRLLIVAEHPELQPALDEGRDQVAVGDEEVNPRLHIAMHQQVASQLWEDEPPEAWLTARRLTAQGYERHEVLHLLGSAVTREIWRMARDRSSFDRHRYLTALAALPLTWEDTPSPPTTGGPPTPLVRRDRQGRRPPGRGRR
jgi:Domain of unknown function (DUF1841)